jgi:hypothetical protein
MAVTSSGRVLDATTFCSSASTAGSAIPQMFDDPLVDAAFDPNSSSS